MWQFLPQRNVFHTVWWWQKKVFKIGKITDQEIFRSKPWWQEILVPPGHVVMWSLQHLHIMAYGGLERDELTVYVGDDFPSQPVWQVDFSVIPDPAMHNTPRLFVSFFRKYTTTFRLLFSFHEVRILVSKTPRKDANVDSLSRCHIGNERVMFKRW